ncbi:MAG: YraN family protein [Actinomycetia bacterium]|nr:YraN family protein [Actinomycetes bacterium]MCP3910516.1 YraN family protein [Actinomycetes bacterium]MCP4084153.1 YraN family protein [Actinomycetes bacterium]
MSHNRRLGAAGEERAAQWYRDRGCRVLDQNWRCRAGELDLVLSDGRVVVFCEVKTRSTDRFGSALEAVTPAKQQRIRRLAAQWLSAHPHRGPIRFDVVAVTPQGIQVVTNAF